MLLEFLQHVVHLRRVLEAIETDRNAHQLWMRPVIVLRKPLDQVGVVEDSMGMRALVGHPKVVFTSDEDVRLTDVGPQQIPKDVPVTGSVDLRVDDGDLSSTYNV